MDNFIRYLKDKIFKKIFAFQKTIICYRFTIWNNYFSRLL